MLWFFIACFGFSFGDVSPYKNIKLSYFKSSENIQKKEGGPDRSVSDNQSSSAALNELAMKARKILLKKFMFVKKLFSSI